MNISGHTVLFFSPDRPIPRLSSSLSEGMFVCPGDKIQFQCATTDSQTLGWLSDVYFGSDAALHFSYDSPLDFSQEVSGIHHAILTSKSMENGRIDLTAMLSITVLDSRESSHSIICLNGDVGTHSTIYFHLAGLHNKLNVVHIQLHICLSVCVCVCVCMSGRCPEAVLNQSEIIFFAESA